MFFFLQNTKKRTLQQQHDFQRGTHQKVQNSGQPILEK